MSLLLDGLRTLETHKNGVLGEGLDPFGVPIDQVLGPTRARMMGREVLLAGTNNYLGLTFDPACVEAACDAVRRHGTGTTGSRMASGSFAEHRALERELAEFYGWDACVVFSAGYLANLGALASLCGSGDHILIDADCHASISEGCRLSGAAVLRFRHNDVAGLERRLQRLGDAARRTLVVVEGLYSMLGDRAPLPDIVEVARKYGARTLVDEAHSLGVLGAHGRGLVEEAGVLDQVDFVVGTFSKSLGGVGGFLVSRHLEVEMVRYGARAYMFTASQSPAVIAGVREALRQMRSRPGLRARLWRNAERLYAGLRNAGFRLGPEVSPVVAAIFEDAEEIVSFWRRLLLEQGVYVNLMLPPATPNGHALVRCSVSAAHTPADIDAIVEAFVAAV